MRDTHTPKFTFVVDVDVDVDVDIERSAFGMSTAGLRRKSTLVDAVFVSIRFVEIDETSGSFARPRL
jgi:hypothetical protein